MRSARSKPPGLARPRHCLLAPRCARFLKNIKVLAGCSPDARTKTICERSGADFIRVCMFTGAGVWDAGEWDEGCAADLMRRRKELHAEPIKLFADVDKKHSVRFPGID